MLIQRVIKALNLDDETEINTKDLETSSLKKMIREYRQNVKSLLGLDDKSQWRDLSLGKQLSDARAELFVLLNGIYVQ